MFWLNHPYSCSSSSRNYNWLDVDVEWCYFSRFQTKTCNHPPNNLPSNLSSIHCQSHKIIASLFEFTKQLAQAEKKERISKVSWWSVEEKQKHTNEVAKNDYQHIVRKMCNLRAFWRIEAMGGLWRKADESFEKIKHRLESFLKNRNIDESFEGKKKTLELVKKQKCWRI
jgi:hypothetical protein